MFPEGTRTASIARFGFSAVQSTSMRANWPSPLIAEHAHVTWRKWQGASHASAFCD
jgi:hypothetical protein